MRLTGRIRKGLRNLPGLLRGFNIYVDRDKLKLLDRVFGSVLPSADSFADLGGVWNVDAAYTFYVLQKYPIVRGYLVDTHFTSHVSKRVLKYPNLIPIERNFTLPAVLEQIKRVDVVMLFDVLLHQVNPNWDEVLRMYSTIADCFVIFNQQYISADESFRLTDLGLDSYKKTVPAGRGELYDFIFAHGHDLNPDYGRPWKDIPDIFQWAITDRDLRSVMRELHFREVYYRDCGQFSTSLGFENHAFIFIRDSTGNK